MLRGRLTLLVIGVFMLAATGRAAAATITVNTTFDDQTPGDGQCSLRKAIAAVESPSSNQTDCARPASGPNTIVLGAGTYPLTSGQGQLVIASSVSGLTIAGDGEPGTVIDASALNTRALDVSAGATVTLSELTITGGHAPDGSKGSASAPSGGSGANGGAILNQGSLTLSDVAVTNSKAGGGGAGASGASARSGGRGGAGGNGGSGGAMYNTGTLRLDGVTISGNAAGAGGPGGAGGHGSSGGDGGTGAAGGSGGGLADAGGTVAIQGTTLSGNSSGGGGAGGDGGDGTTSAGGQGGAGGAAGLGGAVSTDGGTVSITNATLGSNTAGSGGAGGAGGAGKSGGGGGTGGAGASGGAFATHNPASSSLLADTVGFNQAGAGGAGGNGGGGSPSGKGGAGGPAGAGGIYDQGSSTTLQSTLLAANSGGNCAGSVTDGGHNVSAGDTSCPSTFSAGDPRLGPLQDNGGPAQTMALGQGSAAIDQVPPGGPGCPASDERGVPRPSGAGCDIGAYEAAPPIVKTEMAIGANSTGGTLPALVVPNSGTASVFFQYGRSARYGSQTAAQQVGGVAPGQVLIKVVGLRAKTVYHFRVIAVTPDGKAVGADETFTTSATPVVSALRMSPRAFRPAVQRAARARAMITYTDSRAATTSFVVMLCVRSRGRTCTGYARVEAFRHVDIEGVNHIPFSARLHGRPLPAGTYRLTATPMAGRKKGSTVSATFRILD